jgi:hypothetical protein
MKSSRWLVSVLLGLVAWAAPNRLWAEANNPCAKIQQARSAKKLVLLSFVSASFARGCGDSETCADWQEYLGTWTKQHQTSAEVLVVPPAMRAKLLVKPRTLPSFATVLIEPGGRIAIYRGVLVELLGYAALEKLVSGQEPPPSYGDQIAPAPPGLLRCR